MQLMQWFPAVPAETALLIYPDMDEQLVRASWPSTLEQATIEILEWMDEADKEAVKQTEEGDLILFHHGWGTGIRNEFGLWRGNTNLMASCNTEDPDRASMAIIKSVWQRLQDEGRAELSQSVHLPCVGLMSSS